MGTRSSLRKKNISTKPEKTRYWFFTFYFTKPFFFLFLDFFKGLKNSIPQLLHLYFFCFRIKFFLTILYIFKHIHLTNSFLILGGKKTSNYLIYIAVLFQLWLLHIGQTISEILRLSVISIVISKLVLQFSQWYIVIIDFHLILYYTIYYYFIICSGIIYIFISVFNQNTANKSLNGGFSNWF